MAITQPSLISWQAIERSADLLRVQHCLESLEDESLMLELESLRKGRNNRYPIRPLWNALVAGLLLGHPSLAALIRELRRNGELRQVCGFDLLMGEAAVPSTYAFSRFFRRLIECEALVDGVFERLVARVAQQLPEFGRHLVADGKAIHSQRRSDREAAAGVKKQTNAAGESVVARWFGFKVHLICDALSELPISYEVTPADQHESPMLVPLVEKTFDQQPLVRERAGDLAADMGFDDGADKRTLYDDYGLRPLIPARDFEQGNYQPLNPKIHDAIYVSGKGEVCCRVDPFNPDRQKQFCAMEFNGHEPQRGTLKYRCPAAAFGISCANKSSCCSSTKDKGHGRTIRVALERDRRLHLPTPYGTRAFEQAYKTRTSIERLFYRLDHMFGLEAPLKTTGLKQARLRVSLGLCAMLATALAWLHEDQLDKIRSRLQRAA